MLWQLCACGRVRLSRKTHSVRNTSCFSFLFAVCRVATNMAREMSLPLVKRNVGGFKLTDAKRLSQTVVSGTIMVRVYSGVGPGKCLKWAKTGCFHFNQTTICLNQFSQRPVFFSFLLRFVFFSMFLDPWTKQRMHRSSGGLRMFEDQGHQPYAVVQKVVMHLCWNSFDGRSSAL